MISSTPLPSLCLSLSATLREMGRTAQDVSAKGCCRQTSTFKPLVLPSPPSKNPPPDITKGWEIRSSRILAACRKTPLPLPLLLPACFPPLPKYPPLENQPVLTEIRARIRVHCSRGCRQTRVCGELALWAAFSLCRYAVGTMVRTALFFTSCD